MEQNEKKWIVFYTKSRHEKKVTELLGRAGYEVFLPLHKVMRQWSDRKKKVEVPLFNSYIFVRIAPHQVNDVLQIPGVSWVIRHNGQPAVLHDNEYDMIRRFTESGLFLEASGIAESFVPGDRVRVLDGPLRGLQGVLEGSANEEKLCVLIEGIDQIIRVEIKGFVLERI